MDRGHQQSELECALCRGRLQQPKLLRCLHSFCAGCLRRRYGSQPPSSGDDESGTGIACPVCDRITTVPPAAGVDGLKANVYLAARLDEASLREELADPERTTRLPCGSCEAEDRDGPKPAAARCLECALYLCSGCQRAHTRFAGLSDHRVASLEEIRLGAVALALAPASSREGAPKCRRHYGEPLALLCETCDELVCRDCALVEHSALRRHRTLEADGACAERRRARLAAIFPAAHRALGLMEQSADDVSALRASLEGAGADVARAIRLSAEEARARITAEESRLVDETHRITRDRDGRLSDHADNVRGKAERIRNALTMAKNLANAASDADFLSLHATVSSELEELAAQRPPVPDRRLARLQFESGAAAEGALPTPELGRLVPEGEWETVREIGRGEGGGGQGELSCARGMALLPCGDIAVADQWNKRLVIYAKDGSLKKTIPTEDYPFDVASLKHNLLVLDSTPRVKVYGPDHTVLFDFLTVTEAEAPRSRVNLASLAVKRDGTVLVGDVRRSVVTEHRPVDGSLLRTVPVTTPPHYMAVDSTAGPGGSSGRLLLSGADKRVAEAVDDSGACLLTIRPLVGSERVEYCTGVCSDASGFYLAVHNGSDTGHVHHYDAGGKFKSCLASGLHYPMSIKVCADRRQIAVADWTSVKILQMEQF